MIEITSNSLSSLDSVFLVIEVDLFEGVIEVERVIGVFSKESTAQSLMTGLERSIPQLRYRVATFLLDEMVS